MSESGKPQLTSVPTGEAVSAPTQPGAETGVITEVPAHLMPKHVADLRPVQDLITEVPGVVATEGASDKADSSTPLIEVPESVKAANEEAAGRVTAATEAQRAAAVAVAHSIQDGARAAGISFANTINPYTNAASPSAASSQAGLTAVQHRVGGPGL